MGVVIQYSTLSNFDQAYYDKRVRIKAAAEVIHPQFFEQEDTVDKAHVAYFDMFDKLDATPANRLLNALTDPDPETPSETQVGITSYEYGNIVAYMEAPEGTMTISLSEAMLRLIETNMAETIDNVAAYYLYSAYGTAWKTIAGQLTAGEILKILATLEDRNIPRRSGGLYGAIISPHTKRDVFAEGDDTKGFIPISRYKDPNLAFNYELGTLYGFRWASGSSAYHATVDAERHDYPLFFGANAFGQANGYDARVVVSPQLSGLQRKTEVGWKGQRGYGIIDAQAVIQVDVKPSPLT